MSVTVTQDKEVSKRDIRSIVFDLLSEINHFNNSYTHKNYAICVSVVWCTPIFCMLPSNWASGSCCIWWIYYTRIVIRKVHVVGECRSNCVQAIPVMFNECEKLDTMHLYNSNWASGGCGMWWIKYTRIAIRKVQMGASWLEYSTQIARTKMSKHSPIMFCEWEISCVRFRLSSS